ncbi:hypothetical protein OB375_003956 [Salmonella enterica]|nr:hypothetical protein [Salmonella enterica]
MPEYPGRAGTLTEVEADAILREIGKTGFGDHAEAGISYRTVQELYAGLRDDERLYHMSWPDYAVILSSRLLFLSLGAPSAPGCLTASGRQARLRRAVAGAPARLRRTRWRGFGLRYGLMSETPACSDRSGLAAIVAPETALSAPLTGRKAFSLLPLPLRPVSRCGLSGG